MISDLPINSGDMVLDLGCGGGYWSLLAAQRVGHRGRVLGIDIDREAIDLALARARSSVLSNITDFQCSSIEACELNPGSFDVILMFNVLAYSDNPGGALEHAIRALRPGGRLFVKDTDLQSDFFHPVPLDLYHCVVKAAIESSERPRVGNYDPFFARRIPSLLRSLSHCRVIPRSYSFSVFFPVTPEERFFITANAEMLSTLAQLGGNTDLADAWMMLFKDTSKSNVFSSPEFIYSMNEYLFEVTAL